MNATDPLISNTAASRWAWSSIGVNVVLLALSAVVAAASGSLAVGTELVHNGVDLASAAGVLLGVKLASRKTREFPYGLYKLENVVAVAVAGLIFLTVYEILRQIILGGRHEVTVTGWMFALLAAHLAVPLVFGWLEWRAGRAMQSPALIADAKEYQVHVLTTGVLIAALVGEYFRVPLDRLAAVLIVIPVAKTGWELLFDGMRVLLDASLEPPTLEAIRRAALSEPMVVDVHEVTGRNAGRFRFVEITAVLRSNDLEKADRAAHRVEKHIRQTVPNVERVLTHVHPQPRERLRCAVPLADQEGTLAEHSGAAEFFAFAVVHPDAEDAEPAEIVPNPHRQLERGKGIRVAQWLVERKTDLLVLRSELPVSGPFYVLRDAAVVIHRTDAATLPDALAEAARLR